MHLFKKESLGEQRNEWYNENNYIIWITEFADSETFKNEAKNKKMDFWGC